VRRTLRAGDHSFELGSRPWLMGVVNATPDSFSDAGTSSTLDQQLARARELLGAGADVIDIGGESGITGRPPVPADEEIARVAPLIERVAGELDALVSVDTYKPAVAEAAVAAGASIVNDVSGLRDPGLADVCARTGAALVVMHTRAAPKERLQDPGRYDDVVADVARSARADGRRHRSRRRARAAAARPGPDFAKTPGADDRHAAPPRRLHELGRPLLLAVSRKTSSAR
jgi:dihydropteroate synthase